MLIIIEPIGQFNARTGRGWRGSILIMASTYPIVAFNVEGTLS